MPINNSETHIPRFEYRDSLIHRGRQILLDRQRPEEPEVFASVLQDERQRAV
jgi:hypothetical protein